MSSIGMLALFSGSMMPQPETIPEDGEQQQQQPQTRLTTPATPIMESGRRTPVINRSISHSPNFYASLPSPREIISRYVFGHPPMLKTKRSLAEEAESGVEVSVNAWIKDGVDPDELDHYGYTPLLNAAVLGRINAVESLIKNGAEVNRPGPFGFTPLHAAAQNGHREVVSVLLKAGADVNAQNEDQDTPMHLALRAMHIEIVNMLLRNGASTRIPGFMMKDCVQCARDFGLADLAKSLKNYNNYSVREVVSGGHNFSTPNLGLSH